MKRFIEVSLYIVPSLVSLLASPILARGLNPDGRGEYAVVMAVAAFAITFGALGQAEIHAMEIRQQAHRRAKRSTISIIGLLIASLVTLIILIYFLGVDAPTAIAVTIFIPIIGLAGLWRAEHVSRSNLYVLGAQNAGTSILRLCFIAVLFFFGVLGVTQAVFVTQLSAAIGAAVLWYILRVSPPKNRANRILNLAPLQRSSMSAIQILTSAAFTAVLLRADVVVLGITNSVSEVGIYSAAVGLSEGALAISAAFKNRLQAALYSNEQRKRVVSELLIMHAILLPLLVAGALLSQLAVQILFGEAYFGAAVVLQVLMIAAYFQVLMDCGMSLLVVIGRRLQMVIASAIGALTAIFTLFPLTTSFGPVGAAWSSTIAYAATSLFLFFTLFRLRRSPSS